ncbi:MAG: hypothetical protein DME98_07210 [Verrucomicrobia bacterium]|nr:MAG: hypothetical protein DME98_07210 [Verrucomicrobiota bacterium]
MRAKVTRRCHPIVTFQGVFSLIFLLDTASAFLAKRHVTAGNVFSREPPSRRLRRAKGNQEGQNNQKKEGKLS